MSGGSFNYLCFKDASELVSVLDSDLQQMIGELAKLPGGDTALVQTVLVKALLEKTLAQVNEIVIKNDLCAVWQAIEWWHSGDSSQDDAIDSAKRFAEKIMAYSDAARAATEGDGHE